MYSYKEIAFPANIEKNTRFFAIAGFSPNGPVNTPFVLREGVDPLQVLGDCRLAESVMAAIKEGITPLILRLNGSHGECTIIHDELGIPVLRFKTVEATDECNNIEIHLFPTHLIVEGLRKEFVYYFADFKSLDELAMEIKHDLYYAEGEVEVEVLNQAPLQNLCLAERYVRIDDADDGYHTINNYDETDDEAKLNLQLQALKECFVDEYEEGQYDSISELDAFLIDTLLFTDIPYEKAPEELINVLGFFAKQRTNEQGFFCSIVLGSEQFGGNRTDEEDEEVDLFSDSIQLLLNKSAHLLEDAKNREHIEVVVGVQNSVSAQRECMPCAISYAVMRFNTKSIYESATNVTLPNTEYTFNQELMKDEVALLTSSGYNCIVSSIRKGYVPYSARNLYPHNTLYSKPHYLRSIYHDASRISKFFTPLIGEPISTNKITTTLTNIKAFISSLLQESPIYQDISMEVIDYTYETITISLGFKLYGEVEVVKTSFKYDPTGEVTVLWQ